MADQNIKVRVSSSNSTTRYFYVKVQGGEGDNGSGWISVGNTNSGGSQISTSEFSTSKLHTGGSYPSYQALQLWWSTSAVTLNSNIQQSWQWTGSSSVYSAQLDHPDNSYGSGTSISTSAYFLDITFPESDPSSSDWGSWTQRNSSGTELDVTGPTSMTASFTGSTNTSIKLVFNESPRDSSGDKWTSSTIPSSGYSGFSWSPSDSAAITNFSIDSVTYSTTSVTDDTVTLGISYDGSVDSEETLSFTLSKGAVYDSSGNRAGSSGTFSSGTLSWPATGTSGRTYYDRTFRLTNSTSAAVYFLIGVDYGEGTNSGAYVQRGPLAAGQTADYTISQVLMNDFEYSSGGSFSIYPFSSDQSSNLSSSFYPSGTNASITAAQLNAATDGRLEYTWDGSSWSGPTVYDTNGNQVDISVATPTITFANGSGSGTCTIDFGEKIYKSSSYNPSSFSDLSELTSSDISSTYVSRSGGDTEVSSVSVTGVSYDTSDDSGAMAIYGTDNTGNSYGTGWFYPVYLSDPGSSHSHTFTQYSGTTFYMPNSGSNHAQSQPPAGYVHYHDQLVVSFTYSGTATTDDTMSIYFSSSSIYDANLNSGSISVSGAMQSDSGGSSDMSTKLNLSRMSVNTNFVPQGASKASITLGDSSDAWAKVYLAASGLTIAGTAVSSDAGELNLLDGFGDAAATLGSHSVVFHNGSSLKSESFADLAAAMAGSGLTAASGVFAVDFSEITAEAIDVANDTFLFVDATDDGTHSESFADLATAMAGNGLSASGGVFAVGVDDSSIELNSDALRVKALGIATSMLAADAVTAAKLADDAVVTANIVDSNVTLAKMAANSVDSDQYVDGSIDTAHIADLNITTGKLAADAVTAAKLADDAVVTANIVDSNVTLAKMAANSVDSDQYVDGSIDTAHIADSQITLAKMAANSVDSDQYVDGSIDLAHMSANSVDSDQYVDGSIDAAHLASDSVVTAKILDANVTNAKLANSSVTLTNGAGIAAFSGSGSLSLGGSLAVAVDGVLEDLDTLGAPSTDGEFLVASGAGAFAYESGNTARTSLGVGTGDSPQFTNLTLSGNLTVNGSQVQIDGTTVQMDDTLMEMGLVSKAAPTGATTKDLGLLLHRHDGSDAKLQFMGWDESEDEFCVLSGVEETDGVLSGLGSAAAFRAGAAKFGTISQGVWQGTAIARAYIADDAINGAKIADDAVDSEHIADGAIDLAHMSANSIDSDQYVDGSIDTAHLGDLQVTAGKLAADSVITAKILDANVTLAKMAANSIDSDQYVDGSIDTAHIADSQITLAKMAANSVDSDQYVDGSIDTAHIADLNITTGKLAADAVTAAKLADDAVVTANIVDSNVTLAKMAANSVDSDQFVDGSIDTAHIADSQITLAKMAANSVDSDQYVDGSIDLAHMSANSVDSDQYVDGSIDLAHLAADSVDGSKIADDSIDSEHFVDGSIDTAHIGAAQVTKAKLASDIAGDGLRFTSGELSVVPGRLDAIRTDSEVGSYSSSKRDISVDLSGASLQWIDASLQVFLNGMLLRKDNSGAGSQDYAVSAVSSGVYTISLHAVDSSDPMPDDDDVISIAYLLKG